MGAALRLTVRSLLKVFQASFVDACVVAIFKQNKLEIVVSKRVNTSYQQLPAARLYKTKCNWFLKPKSLKKKKTQRLLQFIDKGDTWPKTLVFNNFVLTNRFPNNVFLSDKFDVFACTDIVNNRGIVHVISQKFLTLENAFLKPYVSSRFHIYSGSNLSAQTFMLRPSEVCVKMMALPLNPFPPISLDNVGLRWYLVPLFHSYENGN